MRMDAWYCAGWSCEMAAGPVGRKLLGRDVVLFRDADGTARALGSRCPHRGADLSKGSVVAGRIQCPFHGWCFDDLGRCVRVPSQPESMKISKLARVPSFPLRERQGVLWIWMSDRETQGLEPFADRVGKPGPSVRRLFFEPQLIEGPFLDVLANAFDKAHVPFIHTGSFGPHRDPLVARQRISEDPDGCGLRAEDDDSAWHVEPALPGGWIGTLGRLLGLRRPIAQHARFDIPGVVQIYLEYPNQTYDLFVTHITPVDVGRTWLFVESVRTRAPHAVGDWIQRRAIGKLFEEGQRETSLILGTDGNDSWTPVSVESDKLGLAARRLYERWASGKPDRAPGTGSRVLA